MINLFSDQIDELIFISQIKYPHKCQTNMARWRAVFLTTFDCEIVPLYIVLRVRQTMYHILPVFADYPSFIDETDTL